MLIEKIHLILTNICSPENAAISLNISNLIRENIAINIHTYLLTYRNMHGCVTIVEILNEKYM